GTDALSDAAISAGVLITALIYTVKGISLEAYMGVIISGFIIKAGYEMISDTVSDILGRRTDIEISKRIKQIIVAEPSVLGAYDLFVHNYGPEREYASVHIELPADMTVDKVDVLTRKINEKVYRETGVVMTAVGVYSRNAGSKAEDMRTQIEEVVLKHEWALQMHGFYIDEEKKRIRFDVVMSFDIAHSEGVRILRDEIREICPEYEIIIVADLDITD
ncbi:MAG: cation transporter, partial [Mogibacterium sp.]|nr:cation transporter [Mogibacterium sp.]